MVASAQTAVAETTPRFPYTIEGSIQIFTSPKRGFFSEVMAQALRVAGQGTPVLVVQFLKGGIRQGVDRPVRLGQHLDWFRCDLRRSVDGESATDTETQAISDLWQHVCQAIGSGRYDLAVLDELSLAIQFGFIDEGDAIDCLRDRPARADIILTGTEMPPVLLDMADRVTEIRRLNRA